MTTAPLILDSVTHLKPEHRGRVCVCASHGGRYAGYFAAKMGVGGIVLCDAGVGRDEAGLAGIRLLDELGVPAGAIAHNSARIGDGEDCYHHGRLSFVNEAAHRIGLERGTAASDAYAMMDIHCDGPSPTPPDMDEARSTLSLPEFPDARVILLDSNGLVTPEDAGAIVVTGSHGGLLGGKPETACKADVSALVCNDAGIGYQDAGISRLPALQERGIAAACVSADSARIGEARSTYEDGVISALNAAAEARGGAVGQSCREFVARMAESLAR
jgi:hypothetical protein